MLLPPYPEAPPAPPVPVELPLIVEPVIVRFPKLKIPPPPAASSQ